MSGVHSNAFFSGCLQRGEEAQGWVGWKWESSPAVWSRRAVRRAGVGNGSREDQCRGAATRTVQPYSIRVGGCSAASSPSSLPPNIPTDHPLNTLPPLPFAHHCVPVIGYCRPSKVLTYTWPPRSADRERTSKNSLSLGFSSTAVQARPAGGRTDAANG